MKNSIIVILTFIFLLCGVSCKQTSSGADVSNLPTEVLDITIPHSYSTFSNMEAEQILDSFTQLGDSYYTEVQIVEQGVLLKATQEQLNNIITRTNQNMDRFVRAFEKKSENYRFVGQEDYSAVEFYCDDTYDDVSLLSTVRSIAVTYGLNYILYNRTDDWDVYVRIINCHTQKVVLEGSVRDDQLVLNDAMWEDSYAN